MPQRLANGILFTVTLAELTLLLVQTPTFTFVDSIYISQHLLVLGLALTRRSPRAYDHSLSSSAAVAVSYAYPYAQIALLQWRPGDPAWPSVGTILVTLSAGLSLASLVVLGKSFGVRPALRRLVTKGPYRLVRHPIYLAYVISDIGYNLQEWNVGTVLLVLAGWASLLYRISAEEDVLSHDTGWPAYIQSTPYRLLPGIW